MTVSELIKKLEELPQDSEILIRDEGEFSSRARKLCRVKEVFAEKDGWVYRWVESIDPKNNPSYSKAVIVG